MSKRAEWLSISVLVRSLVVQSCTYTVFSFVFFKEALIMQGTLRKYIIVCNLLLKSTRLFPFELLLPPESRSGDRVFFESVFSPMCRVTECIKLVFGICVCKVRSCWSLFWRKFITDILYMAITSYCRIVSSASSVAVSMQVGPPLVLLCFCQCEAGF